MTSPVVQAGKRATYPAYKPSGMDWVCDIPEHWEVRRLKHLAAVQFSSVDKHTLEGEEPVRLCNYIDVYYNDFINEDIEFMSATATRNEVARFQLRHGDVLVTKDSETWDDIAVSAYVAEELDGVLCGYHLAHIRTDLRKLLGEYLFRAFSSSGVNDQFRVAANGITRFGLGKYWLDNGLFPIPPLDEQRAIAAFLDRETARIDALIQKKQRQIELLQEKRSALISHAVTKGLDPNAKMKDSGIEWLGDIPEHWEVKRVKNLGRIRYGLGEPPEYVDNGLPFIRATDINRGKVNLDAVRKVRSEDVPWSRSPKLHLGEILVVRSGAYTGDSAIITEDAAGCIAGYDMVLTISKAYAPFVAWALLSKYMLHGQIYLERMRAAQPHLNAEELGGFVILMPPLLEQRQIAETLTSETDKLDALADKIRSSIEMLREHRTALISAAVTGKIDVRWEVAV
jgi:type I restriction enzyme S subunit